MATTSADLVQVAVVIPHYNHDRQLVAVMNALRAYDLPVFVVDDGSEAQSVTAAISLLHDYPHAQLIQRPTNGGKGAAVMLGCQTAAAAGFTHALQVDADGQHALEDIPRLLSVAKTNTHAIVTGAPQFAQDMPLSRRFGRYLTHFFVTLETLSRRVGDTMCGFRVYPLASITRLLDSVNMGTRMDFDIEVMVRADWAGIPICHVPTRVVYPTNGVSHFHYLRDNIRITRLHTRLMFGMLIRCPSLLRRWFIPPVA